MKKSSQLGWQCSAFGAAAIIVLGLTLGLTPRTAHAATGCTGDCDGSGDVTVNELITMVNIALGTANVSTCPAGDPDGSGDITINEIIAAVGFALTSCPVPMNVCGDGITTAPEECDDGGTCAGGTNAGTACTKEADCTGNGICNGGTKSLTACAASTDCGGGTCIHCKTFGGDGCAANCTFEQDVKLTLLNGVVSGLTVKAGTSGAVVHGDPLVIPLPLGGTCFGGTKSDKQCTTDANCPGGVCKQASQVFTIGKDNGDGLIPVSIKASSIQIPRIPVSTLACACLRGVAAKTCGGTLFDIDGVTQSADCSDGFTAGPSVCPADKPCSFLHGPANSGSGVVGCTTGLDNVDVMFTQDSGGESGISGKPIITLSGHGGPGSIVLVTNNAIGTVTGSCSGSDPDIYGIDGQICTDDDPQASRGTPAPQVNTSGTVTGTVFNENGTNNLNIGPFSATGSVLTCSELLSGNTSGAALASVFTALTQPTLGDIVVTSALVSQ